MGKRRKIKKKKKLGTNITDLSSIIFFVFNFVFLFFIIFKIDKFIF